jgi:glutaconate CoA-transferase subunit A
MPEFIELAAAARLVQDNSTLAFGGMTIYRRPVAFARALLQRTPRPQNLTLLCFTAGFESDLLVGAGCVETVRSVYFGLETFGLAPMFTETANQGALRIIEETEMSLAMGIRARLAGVGFMPSRAWLGTDLPRLRPDVKTVQDPYSGETLIAFPALHCDVAVIHGLEADHSGNIVLNNNLGVDMELAYMSKTVIATVERIVPQVHKSGDTTILPAPGVHYVVHAPKGAYPTSCHPLYPVMGEEFMRYVDACNSGNFDTYLAQFLNDG